jgi:hypothetical protein
MILRVREGNPSYISLFFGRENGSSGDTIKPNVDFIVEENKIENYIELI